MAWWFQPNLQTRYKLSNKSNYLQGHHKLSARSLQASCKLAISQPTSLPQASHKPANQLATGKLQASQQAIYVATGILNIQEAIGLNKLTASKRVTRTRATRTEPAGFGPGPGWEVKFQNPVGKTQ